MCLLASLLAVWGQRAIDDFSEFLRRDHKMDYLLIAPQRNNEEERKKKKKRTAVMTTSNNNNK